MLVCRVDGVLVCLTVPSSSRARQGHCLSMEGTGCQSGGGRVSGASRMHRMDKLTSQPVQRVSYRIIRGFRGQIRLI